MWSHFAGRAQRVTLTLLHPSVVQKSYAGEKRFFNPPLQLLLTGSLSGSGRTIGPLCRADPLQFSVHFPATQQELRFDEFPGRRSRDRILFRKIYVNDQLTRPGCKNFVLDVRVWDAERPLIGAFPSAPVHILSKPSKKKATKTPESRGW